MQKDDTLYLGHMLDTARKIKVKMIGLSRKDYNHDENLRLALGHLVQIIGEASQRVSNATRAKYPSIPWREMVGMQHQIVLDYMTIDEERVWDVVTKDIPQLLTILEGIPDIKRLPVLIEQPEQKIAHNQVYMLHPIQEDHSNMIANIALPQEQINAFCRRNHIRRLALFGSVLRDDFGPESDIDVLVEFEPEHIPGFAFIRMQDELSELFGGIPVDLLTPKFLNHRIRDRVLSDARVIYAEG